MYEFLYVTEEVISIVMAPHVVKDGEEDVSIIRLPFYVDEPPYTFGILPTSLVFQSDTKSYQEAYNKNKITMAAEKKWNETKQNLRDNMNNRKMQRIMSMCVAMDVKKLMNATCTIDTYNPEEVLNQIEKTKLGAIIGYYYQIGLALQIQVNSPASVLSKVKAEFAQEISTIITDGPQDDEDEGMHMLHTAKNIAE